MVFFDEMRRDETQVRFRMFPPLLDEGDDCAADEFVLGGVGSVDVGDGLLALFDTDEVLMVEYDGLVEEVIASFGVGEGEVVGDCLELFGFFPRLSVEVEEGRGV